MEFLIFNCSFPLFWLTSFAVLVPLVVLIPVKHEKELHEKLPSQLLYKRVQNPSGYARQANHLPFQHE